MVFCCHGALCTWNAFRTFPTADEIGHLPAGVSHWNYGRFDLYRVNPPLVRMVCTCIDFHPEHYDWSLYSRQIGIRSEFSIGLDRLQQVGLKIVDDFRWPRITGLVFTFLGMLVGTIWLTHCSGKTIEPVLFAIYWAFSPDILAHGPTIGPDVGATGFGLMAGYFYWRYVLAPSPRNAILAGVGLGLAILSKLTWVTGLISFPLAVTLYVLIWNRQDVTISFSVLSRDLFLSTFIVLLVVNLGYAFEGTMTPLGDFQFCSEMLGGKGATRLTPKNPIDPSSVWASLPIPLPRNFLLGLDFLRAEVEEKKWSFLLGQWRHGSWSYYYVLTVLFKTPEPTLIASFAGFTILLNGLKRKLIEGRVIAKFLLLGIPSFAVFVSVSLQGGFNHHHRYVMPIYPFLFSLAAFFSSSASINLVRSGQVSFCSIKQRLACTAAILLCILMVISTLRVHPYYTSYFNSISGGPGNGWRLLGFSNVDWGQDLQLVENWIREHPQCRPVVIELGEFGLNREILNLPSSSPPKLPKGSSIDKVRTSETQWWIVSVTMLYNLPERDGLEYLQELEPFQKIAFAYHVYRVDAINFESSPKNSSNSKTVN